MTWGGGAIRILLSVAWTAVTRPRFSDGVQRPWNPASTPVRRRLRPHRLQMMENPGRPGATAENALVRRARHGTDCPPCQQRLQNTTASGRPGRRFRPQSETAQAVVAPRFQRAGRHAKAASKDIGKSRNYFFCITTKRSTSRKWFVLISHGEIPSGRKDVCVRHSGMANLQVPPPVRWFLEATFRVRPKHV